MSEDLLPSRHPPSCPTWRLLKCHIWKPAKMQKPFPSSSFVSFEESQQASGDQLSCFTSCQPPHFLFLGVSVARRQVSLSRVVFVSQHGESRVGEVPQDVDRLTLQQQRLLHELLLRLHQELHRLRQRLQRLGHGGEQQTAGLLLLQALTGHLEHVLMPGGAPCWKGV